MLGNKWKSERKCREPLETKLCFIWQTSTSERTDEQEKWMTRHHFFLIDWWQQDIKKTRIAYWN